MQEVVAACNLTSTDGETDLGRIEVFPNPSAGSLYVGNVPMGSICRIVNSLGHVFEIPTDTDVIDITKYPPGIYYLMIVSKNATWTTLIKKM